MSAWASALAVLIAAAGIAALDTDAGVGPYVHLRDEALTARVRVAEREAEVARLATEIAALSDDRLAVERAIREELDLARAGEWVVRFRARSEPGRSGASQAAGLDFP